MSKESPRNGSAPAVRATRFQIVFTITMLRIVRGLIALILVGRGLTIGLGGLFSQSAGQDGWSWLGFAIALAVIFAGAVLFELLRMAINWVWSRRLAKNYRPGQPRLARWQF